MQHKLRRLMLTLFATTFATIFFWPTKSMLPVYADVGPKPSLTLTINGLDADKEFHVGLFSQSGSGPNELVTPDNVDDYTTEMNDNPAFARFYQYGLNNSGYYFINTYTSTELSRGTSSNISWNYYPPEEFEIGIYDATDDVLLCSESSNSLYAFDSYFSIYVGNKFVSENAGQDFLLPAANIVADTVGNYDFAANIALRMLITVVAEVLVALLFKYRSGATLVPIIAANIVTQGLLNGFLLLAYRGGGYLTYYFTLGIGEILVIGLEAVFYWLYFRRLAKDGQIKTAGHPIWYALAANILTLALTFLPFLNF